MKKNSVVWKFFDRIDNGQRTVAVTCKLCDTQYKFFGNTTNLRAHLCRKHPIQWELSHNNGILDEEMLRKSVFVDADNDESRNNDSVEPYDTETEQNDEDQVATIHLVDEVPMPTDEEWLEEEAPLNHFTKRRKIKAKKIKREVISPPPRQLRCKIPGTQQMREPLYIREPNKRDEFSVFGEYVASKLRKFQNSKTRGNLQQLITTILWQAEYGLYSDADSVRKLLTTSLHTPAPGSSDSNITAHEVEIQTDLVVHPNNIIVYNEAEVTNV